MNSLTWLLATLVVALLTSLLLLTWLLVNASRKATQSQATAQQQSLSALSMTLVQVTEESRKALTEHSAKTLGAMTAMLEQTMRGASSAAERQQALIESLIPLLASKEPMAYSQIRQTDVALSPERGTDPYPATDDAAWTVVQSQVEVDARREAITLEQEGREFLEKNGLNVDAYGFPTADQPGQ